MDCAEVLFSGHAIRRMFERSLRTDDILAVVRGGEVVAEYPQEHPFPSSLLLGFASGAPVHVVVARDPESRRCFVVTAYRPDPIMWSDDFRMRRR